MFAWLGIIPDETLTAYFIPYRSRDYETLRSPGGPYAFAVGLWRRYLPKYGRRWLSPLEATWRAGCAKSGVQ